MMPDMNDSMAVQVALDRMSLPEKLELMEALWDNLTRRPDELSSPAWHEEVLEECRQKAESKEEQFTDWETAKLQIRRQVL